MKLEDRVALVTGGAHRLGRAIVEALAERGAGVVVHYGSSEKAAARTVAALEERGGEAWAIGADLSRPSEIDRLFAAVRERCGRLDVLVNSAASFEEQELETISAADWDRVQAINLRAPFLCMRAAAPLLRGSSRPRAEPAAIVNLADLSALQVWRGFAHHAVSKAGLVHLTRTAARELAPQVRVNAVAPGAILPPPGGDPESEEWRRRGDGIPLGRTGEAAEVGAAVAFLVAHDFVTGVVLPVDGGEHLRERGARS